MAVILSESQRLELHKGIVGYLMLQNISSTVVASVRQALAAESAVMEDGTVLERKWISLVRSQRKLLDLEARNFQLQQQLVTIQPEGATDATTGRPSVNTQSVSSGGDIQDQRKSKISTTLASYLPQLPPQQVLEGHRGRVTSVAFHPKYSFIVSGCENGDVKVWDFEAGEIEHTLKAHTHAVQAVCMAPHSGNLVSASADLSIKAWDPDKDFNNVRTMLGHDQTISAVAVTILGPTDQEYVISGSRDKTVRIWELHTGFPVAVFRDHTDWVRCVDVTQNKELDHQYILSAGSDRSVILTKWGDNVYEARKYRGHKHVIESCAFAPPASYRFIARQVENLSALDIQFATAGRDNLIHLWTSSNTDEPIMTLSGHDNWVQDLAFHPNGRFLVSVSDDKTMRIWDLANARLVKTILAHTDFVSCISWQGKHIATGSVDQTVKIW